MASLLRVVSAKVVLVSLPLCRHVVVLVVLLYPSCLLRVLLLLLLLPLLSIELFVSRSKTKQLTEKLRCAFFVKFSLSGKVA